MIEGTLGYVDCPIHQRPRGRRPLRRHRPGRSTSALHDAEQPLLFFQGKYASTDT